MINFNKNDIHSDNGIAGFGLLIGNIPHFDKVIRYIRPMLFVYQKYLKVVFVGQNKLKECSNKITLRHHIFDRRMVDVN